MANKINLGILFSVATNAFWQCMALLTGVKSRAVPGHIRMVAAEEPDDAAPGELTFILILEAADVPPLSSRALVSRFRDLGYDIMGDGETALDDGPWITVMWSTDRQYMDIGSYATKEEAYKAMGYPEEP